MYFHYAENGHNRSLHCVYQIYYFIIHEMDQHPKQDAGPFIYFPQPQEQLLQLPPEGQPMHLRPDFLER